jgi:hypothetical protein
MAVPQYCSRVTILGWIERSALSAVYCPSIAEARLCHIGTIPRDARERGEFRLTNDRVAYNAYTAARAQLSSLISVKTTVQFDRKMNVVAEIGFPPWAVESVDGSRRKRVCAKYGGVERRFIDFTRER